MALPSRDPQHKVPYKILSKASLHGTSITVCHIPNTYPYPHTLRPTKTLLIETDCLGFQLLFEYWWVALLRELAIEPYIAISVIHPPPPHSLLCNMFKMYVVIPSIQWGTGFRPWKCHYAMYIVHILVFQFISGHMFTIINFYDHIFLT